MGPDKLSTLVNGKKHHLSNMSNVRVATNIKGLLVKISSEELKSRRTPVYKYLLP